MALPKGLTPINSPEELEQDATVLKEFQDFTAEQETGLPAGLTPLPAGLTPIAQAPEEEPSMLGDIATQAVASIPSAFANMVQTAAQVDQALSAYLPDSVLQWRNEAEKNVGFNVRAEDIVEGTEDFKKMLPKPEGTAGEITREIGEFATGFVTGNKILSAGNGVLKAMVVGDVAAMTSLDSTRDNIFNLIEEGVDDPKTKDLLNTYLSNHEDSPSLRGRVLNGIENSFTGVVAQKLLDGITAVKGGLVARSQAKKAEKIKPMYEEAVQRYMDAGYTDPQRAQELAQQALKIKDMDLIKGVDIEDVTKLSDDQVAARAKELDIDVEEFRPKIKGEKPEVQGELFATKDRAVKEVPAMDKNMWKVQQIGKIKSVSKLSNDELRAMAEKHGVESKFYDISAPKQQDILAVTQDEAILQGGRGLDRKALEKDVIKAIKAEKVPTKVVQPNNQITDQVSLLLKGGKSAADKTKLRQAVERGVMEARRANTKYTDKVAKLVEKETNWRTAPARSKGNLLRQGFNKGILGLRERLGSISKSAAHKLNRHEQDVATTRGSGLSKMTNFHKGFSKMNSADKARMKELLLAEDNTGFRQFIAQHPRMAGVQAELDSLFKEFGALGKQVGEFEYDPNFFPKLVEDFEGLRNALNPNDANKVTQAIEAMEKKLGRGLTGEEASDLINKSLFSGHLKSRTVTADMIKQKNLAQYYADPVKSLEHYVNNMSETLHRRKFFGQIGKGVDLEDPQVLKESIGATFGDDLAAGRMNSQDVLDATKLLEARFGMGSKSPTKLVQGTKNFMYMTTLANPLSAATQAGDAVLSAHINGIGNAVYGLVKTLSPIGKSIEMKDIGLHDIAVDMQSGMKSHQWLNKTMKWSGFSKMDEIGKETIINGSMRKNAKRMGSRQGRMKFRDEYKEAFAQPGQLDQVMDDLARGNMTPDVKYVLWNDVTKMQPISLSEMPEAYLKSPNVGRLLYSLKTFTIKQLNRMYFDGMRNITEGNVRKGTAQLMGFAGFLTAGGMGTDAIKDMIQGREQVNVSDRFQANLLKVLGTSDYVTSKMADGDIEGAVSATILPPIFKTTRDMYHDLEREFDPEKESKKLLEWNTVNDVPVVGRLAQQWWGGGAEKHNDRLADEE